MSLHAATDELRDRLVPLNRTYPLDAVFAACERYVEATRRKLLFEYVVLRGVNDTPSQVAALAQRLRRPLYHLNLIAYNETGGEFTRPAAGEIEALRARLERAGVSVTVRQLPRRRHRGRLRPAGAAPRSRRTADCRRRRLADAADRAVSSARQGRAVLCRRGLRRLVTMAMSVPSSKPASVECAGASSRCQWKAPRRSAGAVCSQKLSGAPRRCDALIAPGRGAGRGATAPGSGGAEVRPRARPGPARARR